jgi:hypothetical protein
MHLSRRPCFYASLAVLAVAAIAPFSRAETLTITSSPPGAAVEIDGRVAGATPYKTDYPGGYFHKTHTAFGSRLEHSITLRISKDGYITQQITITNGPFEWVAITGRHRGNYFLLKANRFEIKLEPISLGSSGRVGTATREGPMRPATSAAFESGNRNDAVAVTTGSVAIASDPSNAEIYVDGQFVGQTPSTLQLPAGSHHIEMKADGKHTWSRDLEVLKGSQLAIHALLDAPL